MVGTFPRLALRRAASLRFVLPTWLVGIVLLSGIVAPLPAHAATPGKLRVRVIGSDDGAPMSGVDVVLLPADTTLRRVGAITGSDGVALLQAAPGTYRFQARALSYAVRAIPQIVLRAGELNEIQVALVPDAIQQPEVVVEANALRNTETALLAERRKAASVGDAVSAEQVRRTPDKDAAEVLRRVTGLSVADGKYVFVRGLGERYSSTEVDGVRIASPEQNKRVVPLDLLPANLLENIVVQKTYTADRPGEFGGGDVQIHTRDFPGHRVWSVSVTQGDVEGSTFHDRLTYSGSRSDLFGFGSHARRIPDLASGPLPTWSPSHLPSLAGIGRSFGDVWSARSANTVPNAGYTAAYGDEFKIFGHPLGLVESWSFGRAFNQQDERQKFYEGTLSRPTYDYQVVRATESAQMGALSGMSYRFTPHHTVHLRGLYTNNADNETRVYQGPDVNVTEATTGEPLVHRDTRLLYVQRTLVSGALEAQHEFPALLGASLDWKLTRSSARRQQPDRREVIYDRRYYFEGDTAHWVLGSIGRREFGDLRDNGWGATASLSVPLHAGRLGNGKIVAGYDDQNKDRNNFYRRFSIHPNGNVDRELPPDSVFAPGTFDSTSNTAWIEDVTNNDPVVGVDNYRANQRSRAGYLSAEVPLGRRLRSTIGVRAERGYQDVQSFALFRPQVVLAEGRLDNLDWLPSANLTFAATEQINVRLAASRTLSRPDLNELSPSPFYEYVGGYLARGNPALKRARIDNYDLRVEAFPGLSEVLAAGVFYKRLMQPIEQVIKGGTPHLLIPENSDHGRNLGLELEARLALERLSRRLRGLSINANSSFIRSRVLLRPQTTQIGSFAHPLQGQSNYLVNLALVYAPAGGAAEAAVLVSTAGNRLVALGGEVGPDIYEQPLTSLDLTAGFRTLGLARVKLAARNLLDPQVRRLQADNLTSAFQNGRSYSIALTIGS